MRLAHGALRLPQDDAAAAQELGERVGVSPTIAQVLKRRGLSDPSKAGAYLDPRLGGLTLPEGMADRDLAAERLARAVQKQEPILVFGDYDVDGITATVLLTDFLRALGAEVTPVIANRFAGGYGLSAGALERCREAGASLWITCDCGSSDHERLAAAQAEGIDVIVVDHHLVPDEPLPALAFLNPHRLDCGFPFKGLASVGLVFSLVAALRSRLKLKMDLRPWLDLVALGTIADLAPLRDDNRRLVHAGLQRLAQGRARPGLKALLETARVPATTMLRASDVSFRLAPRLNAPGRLGDARSVVDLLLALDSRDAYRCARRIEERNALRRQTDQRVTQEALQQVQEVYGPALAIGSVDGIVVAGQGWHRGVVGIVASRLVEATDRPVLAVALDGSAGTGSGRAPEGFPLYNALAACRHDLMGFGGHQAAVGLSCRADQVEALRADFDAAARDLRPKHTTQSRAYEVDVLLDGERFDLPTSADLARLEPLGLGNDEPVFAIEGASLVEERIFADRHLELTLRWGRRRLRGLIWQGAETYGKLPHCSLWVGMLRAPWRSQDADLDFEIRAWQSTKHI